MARFVEESLMKTVFAGSRWIPLVACS